MQVRLFGRFLCVIVGSMLLTGGTFDLHATLDGRSNQSTDGIGQARHVQISGLEIFGVGTSGRSSLPFTASSNASQ
jgi:hypothetical protein